MTKTLDNTIYKGLMIYTAGDAGAIWYEFYFEGSTEPIYFDTMKDAKNFIDDLQKGMQKSMKWNDDWRDELKANNEGCYIRLCECRNTRNDLVIMANLMHKYNPETSAEDCFERIIEWVGGWNNQFSVTDLTTDEYNKLLKRIK